MWMHIIRLTTQAQGNDEGELKHSLGDLKYILGIGDLRCLPLSQKGIGLMHAQGANSVGLGSLVEHLEKGVKTIGRTRRNKNSH